MNDEKGRPTPTLDEWTAEHAPHLKQNLEANLRVYAPDMDPEEFASLIRLNLIMVRDWAGWRKP